MPTRCKSSTPSAPSRPCAGTCQGRSVARRCKCSRREAAPALQAPAQGRGGAVGGIDETANHRREQTSPPQTHFTALETSGSRISASLRPGRRGVCGGAAPSHLPLARPNAGHSAANRHRVTPAKRSASWLSIHRGLLACREMPLASVRRQMPTRCRSSTLSAPSRPCAGTCQGRSVARRRCKCSRREAAPALQAPAQGRGGAVGVTDETANGRREQTSPPQTHFTALETSGSRISASLRPGRRGVCGGAAPCHLPLARTNAPSKKIKKTASARFMKRSSHP